MQKILRNQKTTGIGKNILERCRAIKCEYQGIRIVKSENISKNIALTSVLLIDFFKYIFQGFVNEKFSSLDQESICKYFSGPVCIPGIDKNIEKLRKTKQNTLIMYGRDLACYQIRSFSGISPSLVKQSLIFFFAING